MRTRKRQEQTEPEAVNVAAIWQEGANGNLTEANERARYHESAKAKSTIDSGAVFLVDIDQE
jgi:hypothetical protein